MRWFITYIILFCILSATYAYGPREPFSGQVVFDAELLSQDIDAYLERSEGRFQDIRQGLEKQIVWADPQGKQKTEFSVVYIHGFSASLSEVRPLPDEIAASLGANLFYTRLKGHGRTGEAMAEASADDWLYDMQEALAIGERLGEKVIVISTSMGSVLASWVASNRPVASAKVVGHVMISPSFKLADPAAFLLNWPFARYFVPVILGDSRGKKSENSEINHAWTLPHSTWALIPMAAIIEQAARSPLDNAKVPLLVIYSPNDQVVSPQAIEKTLLKWGGPTDSFIVANSGHETNHVVVGQITSPSTTKGVVSGVKKWLEMHF